MPCDLSGFLPPSHGQKIRNAPREVLSAIPGLRLKELPQSEVCCGSAGVYNIVHDELAASLLESKMAMVNLTGATIVATANPGCMLQLRAGVERHGKGQRVLHVVELLDEAYRPRRDLIGSSPPHGSCPGSTPAYPSANSSPLA